MSKNAPLLIGSGSVDRGGCGGPSIEAHPQAPEGYMTRTSPRFHFNSSIFLEPQSVHLNARVSEVAHSNRARLHHMEEAPRNRAGSIGSSVEAGKCLGRNCPEKAPRHWEKKGRKLEGITAYQKVGTAFKINEKVAYTTRNGVSPLLAS